MFPVLQFENFERPGIGHKMIWRQNVSWRGGGTEAARAAGGDQKRGQHSAAAGFEDAGYFARKFRRQNGVTPSAFE
jgi:hypothetical protein